MKHLLFSILFITTAYPLAAQPRIHAHNDYQQAVPLTNALHNRAYSIEADLYLTRRGVVVVHEKKIPPQLLYWICCTCSPLSGFLKNIMAASATTKHILRC